MAWFQNRLVAFKECGSMCRWTRCPLYGDLYVRALQNPREKTVRDSAVFVWALKVF